MMKRKTVSGLISVLLCLSFLAGAFAACGKKDETDPSHEEEYDGLVVFAEGKETDFKVVRGETAPNAETDAAKNLRVELIALSGKEIAIATDYVGRNDPDPTDAFEILVGKTKRPESQTAYEALEKQLEKDGLYDGYGVAVIGHKIAVVGTSERMLRLACERFANLFDGAELRLPNGFAQYTSQKSVTPDDYFTSDAGYRLDPDPQKRIATIGVVGGFNVCQGYCSDGKFFYVGLIDKKKSPETIRLEKRLLTTGELVLALDDASTGHANDLTYYPETNEIAIVNETELEFFSAETLVFTHKITLPAAASATAYEPTSQCWALLLRASSGRDLAICDKDFKLLRSVHIGSANQGITCTENAILVLTFDSDEDDAHCNKVEAYSWNGRLMNTYYLGLPGSSQEEAEELFVVGNDVYVGYYVSSKIPGFVHKCVFTRENKQ